MVRSSITNRTLNTRVEEGTTMPSPASVKNHPIHPMLIPIPIALWIFSLVSDVIYRLGLGGLIWNTIALYAMAGGVIGALVAAVPGYLDFRSLNERPVVRIGKMHIAINLSLVVLYSVNIWLRVAGEIGAVLPFVLSIVGVALLGVSGWLGGELVYVHGVAVAAPPEDRSSSRMKERGRAA
jgi:uncharacterized membrane protein